jgi:ketosteroid isomerase-like protein
MSEENVEIVRRIYDAAADHESGAVLALYDPDVELDLSHAPYSELIGRRVYHGHDGLRAFFREWYGAWETLEPDVEELIDAGERVISVEITRGRGDTSGIAVELTQYGVWTIRAGKVVRAAWFGARAGALEAAGLRE